MNSLMFPAARKSIGWGVAKWLRRRFLVAVFEGSNPSAPANLKIARNFVFRAFFYGGPNPLDRRFLHPS